MDALLLDGFSNWPILLIMFAVLGALTGFVAGLLGVGGGVVIVPGLFYIFKFLGLDPSAYMHVFIGTSLTLVIPTGLSSVRAHRQRGAVDFDLVKRIGIGIVFGVIIGAGLADHLAGSTLKMIFACAILCLAVIMLADPSRFQLHHEVPRQPWAAQAGAFIGMISTLVGIGGATLSVPFMSLCRVPIHKAIGTAAALGIVIAVPGTIGFIIIGWGQAGLPPYSLGYVNVVIWGLIMPVSILCAPLGAAVSHKVPVKALRKGFAVFILFVSLKMVSEVFFA